MVSKASEDFPEPDRPVKTTRRSLGISRWTSFRLCSRAPRTIIRSAIGRRLPGCCDELLLADGRQHPDDLVQLVADRGRLLEPQVLGRRQHLLLEPLGIGGEALGVHGPGLTSARPGPAAPSSTARAV